LVIRDRAIALNPSINFCLFIEIAFIAWFAERKLVTVVATWTVAVFATKFLHSINLAVFAVAERIGLI